LKIYKFIIKDRHCNSAKLIDLKKLNATQTVKTIEELHQAFKALLNNEDAAVVILTGSGEKAFVAGADISEFSEYSVEEGKELAAKGQEIVFDYIANFPKTSHCGCQRFCFRRWLGVGYVCPF